MDTNPLTRPGPARWESLKLWVTRATDPAERRSRIAAAAAEVAEWPASIQRATDYLRHELDTGKNADLHPLCNHIKLSTADITPARMPALVALARHDHILHLTLWGASTPGRIAFLEQLTDAGLRSISLPEMTAEDARVLADFAPTVRSLSLPQRVVGGEIMLGRSAMFAALTTLHIELSQHAGVLLHDLARGEHPIEHLIIKHSPISDADLGHFLGAGGTAALSTLTLIGTRSGFRPRAFSQLSVLEQPDCSRRCRR